MTFADRIRAAASAPFAVAPSPGRRFDAARRHELRIATRRLGALLSGYTALSAIVHAATAGGDPSVAGLAALSLVAVAAIAVLSVRPRSLAALEAAGVAAGVIALAVMLEHQMLRRSAGGDAVTVFQSALAGITALMVPWRPVVHRYWLLVVAAAGLAGIAFAAAPGEEVVAMAATLVFAVATAAAASSFAWNQRVAVFEEHARVTALAAEARRLRRIDPVTGVMSRAALEEHLDRLRNSRSGSAGFVIADIDFFKAVNDTVGHLAGDAVLRSVSQAMRGSLRAGDQMYRYGGEEFLVVLDTIPDSGTGHAAERMRAAVEALGLPNTASATGILTVSAGAAEVHLPAPDGIEAVIAQADARLYVAKHEGRNRVVAA